MAVERCNRCGRFVDLDWHVEEIEYLGPDGLEPVCINCFTEEEADKYYDDND